MSEKQDDVVAPPVSERVWYFNVRTQEKGYRCEVGGVPHICKNRPHLSDNYIRLNNEWSVDRDFRPLSIATMGQVLFESDAAVCKALGRYAESRKSWASLSEKDRIRWMKVGPPEGAEKIRFNIYKGIKKQLQKISGSTDA